jgi:hypothetical protein
MDGREYPRRDAINRLSITAAISALLVGCGDGEDATSVADAAVDPTWLDAGADAAASETQDAGIACRRFRRRDAAAEARGRESTAPTTIPPRRTPTSQISRATSFART